MRAVVIAMLRPQSPTWFWRSTVWPRRSKTRAIASPMMGLRRWPTCICLARLTPMRSTTMRSGLAAGGTPSAAVSIEASRPASAAGRRRMLMKPGPAIEASVIGSARSPRSRCLTIAAATSRGFWPTRLARPIAALAWKSPSLGSLQGVMSGSASGACGKARAMALRKRTTSRSTGSIGSAWAGAAEDVACADSFMRRG